MVRKEVEVITTKPIFVAEDGKQFDTEQECTTYEEELHKIPTVTEMIAAALDTDSRKRKSAYQTELEALGYTIERYNGKWWIENPSTNAYIYRYYRDNVIHTSKATIRFGYINKHSWNKGKPLDMSYHLELTDINLQGILDSQPTFRDNSVVYNVFNSFDLYERNHAVNSEVAKMIYALQRRKDALNTLNTSNGEMIKELEEVKEEYEKKVKWIKRDHEYSIQRAKESLSEANEEINTLLKK